MAQFSRTKTRIAPIFAGLLTLQVGCATNQSAAPSGVVLTQQQQVSMTPDAALADLKAGNRRFVAGQTQGYDLLTQAKATASGQYPKAIILGCLDSRVPPEMVFDQGIGDIFVGRVAGNFENQDLLGSMEFGTKLAGSKLIVVLGHGSCGAVKGAIDQVELGNLTATLENINVDTSDIAGERSSKNKTLVASVIESNVRQTVRDIQSRSPVIADLVEQGELKVVGAIYNLDTGRVSWLD
ncbi:MAG TPA: carbonic anhydrase [Phycisphaerales bacterium]|nr:carbonic anhydrase [Phycisphaerales bacterium]